MTNQLPGRDARRVSVAVMVKASYLGVAAIFLALAIARGQTVSAVTVVGVVSAPMVMFALLLDLRVAQIEKAHANAARCIATREATEIRLFAVRTEWEGLQAEHREESGRFRLLTDGEAPFEEVKTASDRNFEILDSSDVLQAQVRTITDALLQSDTAVRAALDDMERLIKQPIVQWALNLVRRPALTVLAGGLTSVAAAVAGRSRPHARDEWLAHLAGSPEDGATLSPAGRLAASVGFVVAAVKFRASDLAAPVWRPLDWLLATRPRTRTVITGLTGAHIIYITATDGLHSVVVANWASPFGLYVALTAGAAWLRRRRGIELAAANGSETQ